MYSINCLFSAKQKLQNLRIINHFVSLIIIDRTERDAQSFMDILFCPCNPQEVSNILKSNKMNLNTAFSYYNRVFDCLNDSLSIKMRVFRNKHNFMFS